MPYDGIERIISGVVDDTLGLGESTRREILLDESCSLVHRPHSQCTDGLCRKHSVRETHDYGSTRREYTFELTEYRTRILKILHRKSTTDHIELLVVQWESLSGIEILDEELIELLVGFEFGPC